MTKVNLKLIVLLILMFLVLSIFIIKIVGGLSWKERTASTVGTPLVLKQENDIVNSSITQVLESKDIIFLVYGYKSIVQAYSLEGTYLYTLSVYNYLNGRAEIAFNKDSLYISDKRHNMYVFLGEECVEFIDKSHSWDLYSKLNFGRSSPNYSIEAGSVWCQDGENYRCIVKRPIWEVLFQNNNLDLLLFFLLILTGMVLRFPYLIKKK